MFNFLYLNLKHFNKQDEENMKLKIKNTDFNFTSYGLDTILNECKFISAIQEFKKISDFKTPFEKLRIIDKVINICQKEARETFEKHNKTNKKIIFNIEGDNLNPIVTFIIMNCDVKNIITEINMLRDFKIKESFLDGSAEYCLTHFYAAIMQLTETDKQKKSQTFTPYIINNNLNDVSKSQLDFSFGRALSFVGGNKDNDNDETKINRTNTIINASVNVSGIQGMRNMFS